MTQKFSQSHFRIQTRSQRRSEGPRPRRLTKVLQPSSQCPMGAYQPHRDPDTAQAEGWCACERDTRQGPDRVCFSSSSGSNSRSPRYSHMPKQNRAGSRPWYVLDTLQDIDTDKCRNATYHQVHRKLSGTHTGVCTSLRIGLGCLSNQPRNCSSLARVLYTFLCSMTLSVITRLDVNVVSTLFNITVTYCIFLSLMRWVWFIWLNNQTHCMSTSSLVLTILNGPIIRRTSPFTKTFHVDDTTTLPTLQTSLAFLIGMCVPLLQVLHDLWRVLNVIWIWFAPFSKSP